MAIKTTEAALTNCFDKALSTFIQQGKRIKGVHDLLVRGTGANSEAILTKNWSDFDLSVILDRVDVTAFNQVILLPFNGHNEEEQSV
ncbi:hypothetical protein [unidentified bacterial endosymbiont]|uniref:hypothetical protein n=1 Tax=unidentified bacterial endosymbiont TaxID=2355 RepID=UPI00209E7C53|nr:hypothetical protein [unidentified bacterial endosymbiont]